MKRRHLKWIVICAFVCICVAAMMGAARNPEITKVENLLDRRCAVMENMLFGKITYEEGKRQLREIETGSLYEKDVESVLNYRDSDFDSVEGMEVLSLEKKDEIYDIKTFHGRIRWTCRNYDGVYKSTDDYLISTTNKGGEVRLISMEIQK